MAGTPRSAQVLVPCDDLDAMVQFCTDALGMRVEAIFPADDPTVAVVTGLGVRLRLDSTTDGPAPRLRLLCDDTDVVAAVAAAAGPAGADRVAPGAETLQPAVTAPNGMVFDLVLAEPPIAVPPVAATLVVDRLADARGGWHAGRAGMLYRDIDPGRQGGRFIASHIAIPDGGPVQDYVHYHRVRFQLIVVRRGWVRLVYEGQGPEFVMHEGDCVLQPPTIRHRVLETSAGFEVIEIGCPAEHETFADLEATLPDLPLPAEHTWHGQRFVHHVAATAPWQAWRAEKLECRRSGIAAATDGLATVRVARPRPGVDTTGSLHHDGELWFGHLLHGSATLTVDDRAPEALTSGDSVMVPAGATFSFSSCSPDLELLEVALPA